MRNRNKSIEMKFCGKSTCKDQNGLLALVKFSLLLEKWFDVDLIFQCNTDFLI